MSRVRRRFTQTASMARHLLRARRSSVLIARQAGVRSMVISFGSSFQAIGLGLLKAFF